MSKKFFIWLLGIVLLGSLFFGVFGFFGAETYYDKDGVEAEAKEDEVRVPKVPPLDKVLYDLKLKELANNPPPPTPPDLPLSGEEVSENLPDKGDTESFEPEYLWPVKTEYPLDGAILPFHRIIAYYGNLYSRKMGVLGEYPEDEMLAKLASEVAKWEAADPGTPVLPALHYIAVVAQGGAGADGKYRARMPSTEIDKVLAMAEKINAIVFLDVQVGFSTVEAEIPLLEKYLKLPQVHLAIDPEFSMKGNYPPGKVVGTYDALDINFVSNYLAKLVRENDLTPKVLVVHRYTQGMVTNYEQIKTRPEVQIVMHMDGWGPKAKKIGTYKQFIYPEPVQFAGFKLFYKNDLWDPGTSLFEPEELLKLRPIPSYIQYQ